MVRVEVVLRSANHDLHSSLYNRMACNPLYVLTKISGKLHDDSDCEQLPRFYGGLLDIPSHLSAMAEPELFTTYLSGRCRLKIASGRNSLQRS